MQNRSFKFSIKNINKYFIKTRILNLHANLCSKLVLCVREISNFTTENSTAKYLQKLHLRTPYKLQFKYYTIYD